MHRRKHDYEYCIPFLAIDSLNPTHWTFKKNSKLNTQDQKKYHLFARANKQSLKYSLTSTKDLQGCLYYTAVFLIKW